MRVTFTKLKTIVLLLSLLVFGLPQISLAQEEDRWAGPPATEEILDLSNTIDCFDYYKFGSVKTEIDSNTQSIVSGSYHNFRIKIINENDYPIVDGAIYAKIFFKKDGRSEEIQKNGHIVVDQFFIKEEITLDAKEVKSLDYAWKVPDYALSGDYYLATYFVSNYKFNLLGLSFTDDVVGNISDFYINGENRENIFLDKDSVYVDSEKYRFAAYTPRVSSTSPIVINATVVNDADRDLFVPLRWKIYNWDALSESNLLEESNESVIVPPNSKKEVSFTVKDNKHSVYLVVVQSGFFDTKSILNIRFVREGVDRTRINFPSITSFPLERNTPNKIFSCLHNAGTANVVDGGKMVLTLTDFGGKEIHKYEYIGSVTGAMMGVGNDFTPTANYDKFILKSELYRDGKIVDTAEAKYDCSEINKDKCFFDWTNIVLFFLFIIISLFVYKIIRVKFSQK